MAINNNIGKNMLTVVPKFNYLLLKMKWSQIKHTSVYKTWLTTFYVKVVLCVEGTNKALINNNQ